MATPRSENPIPEPDRAEDVDPLDLEAAEVDARSTEVVEQIHDLADHAAELGRNPVEIADGRPENPVDTGDGQPDNEAVSNPSAKERNQQRTGTGAASAS